MMLIDPLLTNKIYGTLLFSIAVYVVLWIILSFFRYGRVSNDILKVLHLAFFIWVCEWLKAWPIPAPMALWINGIQLALLAFLMIHVVVRLYIGRYLEHSRHVVINVVIRDLIKFLILALFILCFLRYVLKFNLATILTPSAILTAIIGLSMQDTLGNLIAGIIIQIEKPFDLNDWIEIDGLKGQVREINWRYTKIETIDKLYVIVPNNKISSEKIINYSKPTPTVKQFLDIGVSYEVPPVKVKRAVLDILKSNPHVTDKDSIDVLLHHYGDSSINYQIVYAIDDTSFERAVKDEVYSTLWYQFQKQNITIPYPIRTVIMKPQEPEPDLSDTVAVISKLRFFEGVSLDNIRHLVRFGLLHVVEKGYIVFDDQEMGDTMFFIIEGHFSVIKQNQTLATLHQGDFFGEMSLLTGEKRTARVEAGTHGKLLEIDRSAFKILIETEPIMIRQIEKVFDERARAFKESEKDQSQCEVIKIGLFNRFKKLFGLANG